MNSKTWVSLASLALLATILLAIVAYQPGTQIWAALGAGFGALITIRLTVRAVLAEASERVGRTEVRR